jgi:hypothetical protein
MNATSTSTGSTAVGAVTTTLDRVTATGFQTNRRGRLVSVASAVYVASWITGLVLAPATPAATASAEKIHDYYATNGGSILVQSSLIHGIAGIAIAVLALAIPAATSASTALTRVTKAAGVTAAAVSLLQVAFAAVAVATSSTAAASTSNHLFDDLNVADTVKLTLLAAFAAGATLAAARARTVGRKTRALTAALVVSLPIGGAAFLIDNPILTAVLYVSLPLLLIWVATFGWQVGRRAH